MSEEKKEGKEGEAAAAPKSKKKLIIIIAAVVVLGLVGGGAAMMMGGKKEASAEQEVEKPKVYATFPVSAVIVNLSESTAFLKVSLLVEYDPEILAKADAHAGGEGGGHGGGASGGGGEGGGGEGGFPGHLGKREPMIRDAIIKVLSSKKTDELLSPDGKDRLKEELIEAINEASGMEEGPIVNIYFTEFLIQ